jgi:hypothetical protein
MLRVSGRKSSNSGWWRTVAIHNYILKNRSFTATANFTIEQMANTLLPNDYSITILEIKERINKARFESLKAVNNELILMYLEIGNVISDKVATGWGDAIVDRLSLDLQREYPGIKGFSSRNPRRMKYIYERCQENEFWPQLVAKLTT